MIRVFKTGRHAHRTPLSYPALAPLWEGTISLVDRPSEADLYLFSHVSDIEDAPQGLVKDWHRRKRPVVLLSEEPFWDTIWGKRPLDPLITVGTSQGALPVHQINHQTSDFFKFDRIPYYLMTNPRFRQMYETRFRQYSSYSSSDLRELSLQRPVDVSFMFERRTEAYHGVRWPEGDVIGLCAWRTELAEACDWGKVERLGKSWQGGKSRFDVADWYGDKMARLNGRARLMGALENTHQPQYVSEKFFDAFACGATPLYFASEAHRIHDFGLPPESWLNLFDLSPNAAAEAVQGWLTREPNWDAHHAALTRLARLFTDVSAWENERTRLARALPRALEAVLDAG